MCVQNQFVQMHVCVNGHVPMNLCLSTTKCDAKGHRFANTIEAYLLLEWVP